MVVMVSTLAGISAAGAVTATQRLDLRVLVVSDGSLTVEALAAALDAEGVPYTKVTLSDPNRPTINAAPGGTVATLVNGFTVNARPTITSLAPTTLVRGGTRVTFTVTGSGFATGVRLTFSPGGGITLNSLTMNSATQLTAVVTIGRNAATGPRNVTVTNTDGGTITSSNGIAII
jgi:hypothetical protein